jgi:predicted regulator of amino acid metabolism with ACT domain
MNAKLLQAKKSYEKKLRSAVLRKNHKQNLKLEQKKVCWILSNLNWYAREIARVLNISHHTVITYIEEVENDPYLKEIACAIKPKKVTKKRKDMIAVEYNIQSNQSGAKRIIGTKHNYDKQNDDY